MSTDDLREQLDLDAIRDRYKKWGHKVAPDSPIADVYRLCDHVTDLRAALDALREENRHLRDQHTRERQSADVARHERDAANAALTAVTDLLDEARTERDRALRQCSTARAEVERLNDLLDQARTERDDVTDELAWFKNEWASATAKRDEARTERDEARAEVASLRACAQVEREAWEAVHTRITAERDAAQAQWQAAAEDYNTVCDERDRTRQQFEALILAADRALAKRDNAIDKTERLRHYTSTACHHGLHESCGKAQHDRGEDGAPHCKWCPEPCRCACHREAS